MPDNYAEGDRYLYLNTPLGPDKLILLTFNGFESMSELFRFQLEVAAKKDDEVAFDQLIGKAISFGVKATDDNDPRHFDGICIEFSEGTRDSEFKYYTIVVAPKLWMLTQRRNCRIFQQKSVHDILTTILTGLDTDFKLQGTYEPREFCVQYNETEFDFASRLMEEEGIAYYFKFSEGSHIMVLMDTPQGHQDVPGATTYTFDTSGGGNRFEDEERISTWRRSQSWSTAKYTLWDHNFQLTDKHLDSDKTINPETVTAGAKTHKLKLNGNDAFEIFEYPGNYAKRFDGISSSGGDQPAELNKIFSDNTRTVGIRMKQVATPDVLFTGGGNCRRFTAGHKFTLAQHFDGDGQYVLTSVTHMAQEGDFRSGSDMNVEHYENSFTAIPMALSYVPARKTPRPRVFGCQTAKVVGPSGEEIFTDKYGRVKVQFRWDREGQENASSSCWLRVGTPWAGKNWGMIHIPRVGQEVIVDFMEGDPDRPIVVGAVYNPDQMPPYKLPDNKTQSGLQTRSSKGGGAANYNEIKFEDLKGSEMLWVHAEKDMDTHVEHDDTQWVEHDQVIKVDNDRTEIVGGTEKVNVKGDRHVKYDGNYYEQVGSGYSLKIGSDMNVKVGGNGGIDAGQSISLKGGLNIVLEASMGVTLKGPGGFITIGPSGIMISGTTVLINSGGAAIPGVPVVAIPPQITPPAPPIAPIPGTSSTGSGPTGPVTLASIPSIPPLPPLPNVAALASQVTSLLNGAVEGAAQSVSSLTSSLMQQINAVGGEANEEIKNAVTDAENQIQGAINDAKDQVQGAVNEVSQEAQQEMKQAANQVADLENQAAQTLQAVQQQEQQVANQAEQIAQQAMQEGKTALAEAAQQAQNAAHQAQQLANQAEQQAQQVASQAEKMANDAEKQSQQELNAASQQLNALTQQASQGVQQVQQQVQTAAQQTQAMAQQAMQQGEQAASQAAQQAQQAANQAEQQAKQAGSQAQQAASQAEQQAQQQAQQTTQGVQNAADQASKEVANTAQQATQEVQNVAQQAGKEGQQAAAAASQAGGQIGQAAGQAFGQVGNTAGQAVQGVQSALGGLGK